MKTKKNKRETEREHKRRFLVSLNWTFNLRRTTSRISTKSVNEIFVSIDFSKIDRSIDQRTTLNGKQERHEENHSQFDLDRCLDLEASVRRSVFSRLVVNFSRYKEQDDVLCHAWKDLEKEKSRRKNEDLMCSWTCFLSLVVVKVSERFDSVTRWRAENKLIRLIFLSRVDV